MPISDDFVLTSCDSVPDLPPGSIVDLIYAKFESFPNDGVALVDDESGSSLTFADLRKVTGQVASGLAKRGFGRKDVLALISSNCIENVPIAHGAIVAGGTLQLVKPLAKKDELAFHLGLTKPKIVVTSVPERVLEAIDAIALNVQDIYVIGADVARCRSVEELLQDLGDANPWGQVQIDHKEDFAVMMLTGGTTGMSKTVPITHDAFKLAILETVERMNGSPDQKSLCCTAFYHIVAFILLHGTWLSMGCGVVHVKDGRPETILRAIEKHKITNIFLSPTLLTSIVAHPAFDESDISSLRDVLLTGAALSPDDEDRCVSKLQNAAPRAEICQGYGMTEIAGPATLVPLSCHEKFERKIGSSGILLPSMKMKVLSCDQERKSCKAGEMGEILFQTPRLLKGYFKNEQANRKSIRDEWYHTGDFGFFDDSEYVFIIDRTDDLIKHKNGLVIPTRVEGLLRSHPGIEDCAVLGRDGPNLGDDAAVMCFVVVREGHKVTKEEILTFAGEKLAPHEQPTGGIHFVENIPKSPAGKMLRRLLLIDRKVDS